MAKCVVLAAIAMLAVACVASPLSKVTTANTKATERLPERPPETPGRQENRVRRSLQISEDQRELMSRQLLQALSEETKPHPYLLFFVFLAEIIQREDCVTDYQGWVDFGRRSTN
ncbi:hypothetical protein M9458_023865 [Cirrhinus mrigala]|uniref:Gastrin/cholecystokinin peptide hormone domain-containing protein n=1 Tax=Cirrhinus mrigala TaxID=683832 RepID=A0ABD0Q588_CIRMR